MSPEASLLAGAEALLLVLQPHGFAFVKGESGVGSGGTFATGCFVKGDRKLEFSVRHGLGMVVYSIGPATLDHEAYLRHLGKWAQRNYPGFGGTVEGDFNALALDLQAFCSDFVSGGGAEFAALAAEHAANPGKFKGFNAMGRQ